MSADRIIAFGHCQCGCGRPTKISPHTDRSKGWVKGQPRRYLLGHTLVGAALRKSASTLGNRQITSHGYVRINLGNKVREYEHIVVAERLLGRKLRNFGCGHPDTEVVHHVNGDKTNNAPSNLLICTHRYHTELHHRLERSPDWPEFPPIARNVGARS